MPLAYKITSTVAFCPVKDILQRHCQLIAIFHAAACVSAVSAIRVHFLTLFDNYPIFQRAYFNVFLQTLKVRQPFVSVVSGWGKQLARPLTLFTAFTCLTVQS